MIQRYNIKIAVFLCLITTIALCGCAIGRRKTTLGNETAASLEQSEAHSATVSKGYLASGPTIKVETETAESEGTIIEQFEKTSKELQENKERLILLEKEIEELKISKEMLLTELKGGNEKLVIAQQLLIENEVAYNEIEGLKADLSVLQKQIKQLNENFLKAQLSEVKAKQELVSAQIQHLQELKYSDKGRGEGK